MAAPSRRLDHVVIAVRDLDAAIASYRALGFAVQVGGSHTGRGTHNAIIRFGLDYLELIAVRDEAEARGGGRSEVIDALAAGDGLVAYALATDDIEAEARGLADAGMAAIGPFAMERQRPDGSRLSWRLVIPGDGSYRRPWPFFIEWDQPDAERLVREGEAAHPNSASGIRSVTVGVRDLPVARRLYGQTIGLRSSGPDRFAAGDAHIVLAESERDGPFAIELVAGTDGELDPAAAAGAHIRLRAG